MTQIAAKVWKVVFYKLIWCKSCKERERLFKNGHQNQAWYHKKIKVISTLNKPAYIRLDIRFE